jgi:hypothetical protein
LPEKKEAHFSRIVDFSVGRGDSIDNARDFLDRSRGGGASKMYFHYCTRTVFGKGQIREMWKIGPAGGFAAQAAAPLSRC